MIYFITTTIAKVLHYFPSLALPSQFGDKYYYFSK